MAKGKQSNFLHHAFWLFRDLVCSCIYLKASKENGEKFQSFFVTLYFQGYQFWNQADDEGRFIIKDVRPGNYSLYAWVPGIVGDYKYEADITIEPGGEIQLPSIYKPPSNIWSYFVGNWHP